jgi:hypothetical protein
VLAGSPSSLPRTHGFHATKRAPHELASNVFQEILKATLAIEIETAANTFRPSHG